MGVESHRFENDEPDSSDRDWHWETKCKGVKFQMECLVLQLLHMVGDSDDSCVFLTPLCWLLTPTWFEHC